MKLRVPILCIAAIAATLLQLVDAESALSKGAGQHQSVNHQSSILAHSKAEQYNRRGFLSYNRKRYKDSLRLFTRASELDRDNVLFLYNRANAFFKLGQLKNALTQCSKALIISPEDISILQLRAEINYSLGRYIYAIEDCTGAISLSSGEATQQLYYCRARAYSRTMQHKKAIGDIDCILALNERARGRIKPIDKKSLSSLLLNRALEHHALGDYEQALADLTRRISFNSRDVDALAQRSLIKRDAGRHDQALADAGKVEQLLGDTFTTHTLYATIFAAKKQHWLAERELNRALSLRAEFAGRRKKHSAVLLMECALAYLQLGKFTQSLGLLDTIEPTELSRDRRAIFFAIKSTNEKHLNKSSQAKADAFAAKRLDASNFMVRRLLADQVEITPSSFDFMFMSFVLSVAPSLLWLWWFGTHGIPFLYKGGYSSTAGSKNTNRERHRRKPVTPLLRSFLFGALLTIPVVLLGQFLRGSVAPAIYMCLIGPMAEEAGKFIACKLAVGRSSAFNEPMDAIVYAASTALGFAFIENMEYFATMDPMTIIGRSIVSVPAHVLFSAWWGQAWSRSRFAGSSSILVARGVIFAGLFHSLHNTLLLEADKCSVFWIGAVALPLLLWFLFIRMIRNWNCPGQATRMPKPTIKHMDEWTPMKRSRPLLPGAP